MHGFGSVASGENTIVLGASVTGTTANTVYTPRMETALAGEGVIMKSPNGTRYKVTVTDGGSISIVSA